MEATRNAAPSLQATEAVVDSILCRECNHPLRCHDDAVGCWGPSPKENCSCMRLAVKVATDYAESLLATIATLRKALQTTEDRVHRMEDVIAGCETCSAALDEKGGVMAKRLKFLSDAAYERAMVTVALGYAPQIYQCQKCGYAVADGYCCERCGDADPHRPHPTPEKEGESE